MDSSPVNDESLRQLGEEWIRAVVEKDFQHLAVICHPDVHSRLMTPKRFDTLENAIDLSQKVENWFLECSSIQKEQDRISLVGEKLAIFYRLRFVKEGILRDAEQQLYCTLRDGRIEQLNLICSGFQPIQILEPVSVAQAMGAPATPIPSNRPPDIHADALLEVEDAGGQESTCAILTPSIKRKLGEMSSGQVLEVHVDDPTAQEDIEAWCRLSGNRLLKMDREAGPELRFYVMKK